jgi:ABC-type dipeptide/oligopeptide/nickel transport system permease component
VVAVVLVVGLVFLAANLVVDILLYALSPHKRSGS